MQCETPLFGEFINCYLMMTRHLTKNLATDVTSKPAWLEALTNEQLSDLQRELKTLLLTVIDLKTHQPPASQENK
jgi:hypothetical protein